MTGARNSHAEDENSYTGQRMDLVESQRPEYGDDEIDGWFETERGHKIPVLRNYRYSIKACWRMVAELNALAGLRTGGLLNENQAKALDEFIGYRTITKPIGEIKEFARPIISKHESMFVEGTTGEGEEPLLQTPTEEVLHRVNVSANNHKRHIDYLMRNGLLEQSKSPLLLDVGYGSGYGSFGWEKSGFRVVGIDNEYGGNEKGPQREVSRLKKITKSNVEFATEDITKQTSFEDGTFDFIYSASVLEHIQDLPAAIREMHRILKPGGVMVHGYNPYFGFNGGHALGILDAPWAHAMLSPGEMKRYIKEFRPHEADIAINWIDAALNRSYPISAVQRILTETGFNIRLWEERSSLGKRLADMNQETASISMNVNPGVSIPDLFADSILLIVQK